MLPHLDPVYIVSCLQGGVSAVLVDALMKRVYRRSFCVCAHMCDASTKLIFSLWGPEDQDTNIHKEIASVSLRDYKL